MNGPVNGVNCFFEGILVKEQIQGPVWRPVTAEDMYVHNLNVLTNMSIRDAANHHSYYLDL